MKTSLSDADLKQHHPSGGGGDGQVLGPTCQPKADDGGSADVPGGADDISLQTLLNAERNRSKFLHDELTAERMKNQGMETIFQCIQEERHENRKLLMSLMRRKHVIKKLKKQLHAAGGLGNAGVRDDGSDMSDTEESFKENLSPSRPKQVCYIRAFCVIFLRTYL